MIDFYGHFLGAHNVDHLHKQAEMKPQSLMYTGERKNWNFERFVTANKEKNTILEGLTDHGYYRFGEKTK